jgi:hypothetical protein
VPTAGGHEVRAVPGIEIANDGIPFAKPDKLVCVTPASDRHQ